MGLFQDNFSMLSELERLAAMVQDPVRVHEIGADQWPLAMIACGLMTSSDPDRLDDNLAAYAIFRNKTDLAARKASLAQLTRFVTQRKGDGWRALLPYALGEPEAELSRKAALQTAVLAQPGNDDRFTGVTTLATMLRTRENTPTSVLDALLDLSDMRFLSTLETLCRQLPAERLSHMLQTADPAPNRLSYSWLLAVLNAHPHLSEQAAALMERMAPKADIVMDLIIPIPSWAYEKPAPQPLHGWTRAEYYARMLPDMQPRLTPLQLTRIRSAFGA